MEPLKLTPIFKDYIWGGNKLRTRYGKQTELSPLAESWEMSCHTDGESIICSGKYKGATLREYINKNPRSLGRNVKGNKLPILIKLIDAADNLSVQVHPNDSLAMSLENQNGKTEMWYVIDADKDAVITYGLRDKITKEELKKAIEENKVEEILNTVPSKKGDVFFVEAGTIHAIGKGNLIAEIQQNSNVTYRLYDYNRTDNNGKKRDLHIEKGVLAAKCQKAEQKEIKVLQDGSKIIGESEYFLVKEIPITDEKKFCADENSYHAIIVIDGKMSIVKEAFDIDINAGETVFVPAGMGKYSLKGNGIVLLTTNPDPKFS